MNYSNNKFTILLIDIKYTNENNIQVKNLMK